MAASPVIAPALTLQQAYDHIKNSLIPQMQGTCGVFSFYNAALLLQTLDESQGKVRSLVDPPKKRYGDAVTPDGSIRKRAKVLFHSAQGEIMSADEMVMLVNSYHGYHADKYTGGSKLQFMQGHLAQGHPLLIAYWSANPGTGTCEPWTLLKEKTKPSVDGGAHWVLIVADTSGCYWVIDPNFPSALKPYHHALLEKSNEEVDAKLYPRYWEKTKIPSAPPVPADPRATTPAKQAYGTSIQPVAPPQGLFATLGRALFGAGRYDIGKAARQKLKNAIIAVS